MPDVAKHAALEAIGFRVAPVCCLCKRWASPLDRPPAAWGHCGLAPYEHEKHTAPGLAGTPAVGTCGDFKLDPDKLAVRVGSDYAARYPPSDHDA